MRMIYFYFIFLVKDIYLKAKVKEELNTKEKLNYNE